MKTILRGLYYGGVAIAEACRWLYSRAIVTPVVRALAEGGRGLSVEQMPYMRGPGRIVLGCRIRVSGKIGIAFSRHGERPTLTIGDNVFIGHRCAFALAKAISIGNDCLIAGGTHIADNDGHPLDAERRRRREPVCATDVKPVRIGNNVWIGARCRILKGVTVGDNAVIGAESVVTKDVAPGGIVAGNPARIIRSCAAG